MTYDDWKSTEPPYQGRDAEEDADELSHDVHSQLICDTQPDCLCSDEPYDCQCRADVTGFACEFCGAAMVRIATDGGERLND